MQEEKLDYNYTDRFHILKITEKGIELVCYDRYGHKIINKCTEKELKEKYIRLVDFLKEAKYVGKIFVRKKPITIDIGNMKLSDTSYMNDYLDKSIYVTDYAMLMRCSSDGTSYFEMINLQYINDNDYIFIGNEDKQYQDKKETYKKIIDEIEDRYQNYKKYYKK